MSTTGTPDIAPRAASGHPAGVRTVPGGESSVILRAAAGTLAAGALLVLLGFLLGGSDAGSGAAVGVVLCVAVFGFGALSVDAVARVLPAAALMIAMLTYLLQVVLMALVFAALSSSGALDGPLDRRWLAGAVIGSTAVWLAAQVVSTTRRRIPVYDLSRGSGSDASAGPR